LAGIPSNRARGWRTSSDVTAAGLAASLASWCASDWFASYRAESFREIFIVEKNYWKQPQRA
jgi:hypothetical protein